MRHVVCAGWGLGYGGCVTWCGLGGAWGTVGASRGVDWVGAWGTVGASRRVCRVGAGVQWVHHVVWAGWGLG